MGILKPLLFFILFSSYLLAQDFSGLKNLDGTSATVNSSQNKLLVYFWATWCPDCREHVKETLPKLASKKNFDILTVIMDKDTERATQYVAKENIKLKTFRDPDKKLSGPLKVFSVPQWAVFEKQKNDWKLIITESGSDDQKMLKALGENL